MQNRKPQKRMLMVCTKEHKVDSDDDGAERSATVGMECQAERDPSVPPEAPNAYAVMWDNGAWGFYSSVELANVALPRG